MKKLLLLTTLFLAFACSKDEGDDNSTEPRTFLEKYDDTSWRDADSEILTFIDGTYFYNFVDTSYEDSEFTKLKEGFKH